MRAAHVIALMLTACSAPATLSELSTAETRADAGDTDGALAAYRAAAQKACGARRTRTVCGDVLLGEAEVLEHAGRTDAAIAAYLAIPLSASVARTSAATALVRAGMLQLRAGQLAPAWDALWRAVIEYPDEPAAVDALHTLVADGRRRDARALADELAKLLTPLASTHLADHLLWSMADLEERELANPAAARALYDQIQPGGLRDDAYWHAARLSRVLGDARGAVQRLRALLATRDVPLIVGSYFSVWLDDAQLELGRILRDDLHDPREAAAAFRKLPRDYPVSLLRDDALYELALTLHGSGDPRGACSAVAQLAASAPDSKFVARSRELCP